MNPSPRAEYNIQGAHPFRLVVCFGSIVDFYYPTNPVRSAIVNAANNRCLGGGGVDGAISIAGGPDLLSDRTALPYFDIKKMQVRCLTGDAVITGPNTYGQLRTPYVIHAVGPNYNRSKYINNEAKGDAALERAYAAAMRKASEMGVEAVAFSLLSAGSFRGKNRTIHEVLKIAITTIYNCGYAGLREVHLCGYSGNDFISLIEVARDLGLTRETG